MIFVILGSQKFQFNRLLKKLDELLTVGKLTDEVYAQIGDSDYIPQHYKYDKFLNQDDFRKKTEESNMVITHGGTGAIIGAVTKGKKVIAVPRLAKFGEHVDDHQVQLITEFGDMGIIEPCFDIDKLDECIERVKVTEYKSYESNTHRIVADIADYIEKL